eukprot:CAMPEP_0183455182 /NCGR_PEP_ID=MMETSP0370-20130417/125996_1 /TAXON_ID=268820 /ORGANISM="Peridinium aciculiferum, Strain PAER-2" /LENGTH=152 /DNA_ID=CAMNT_0025646755 /DNA_START=76 /DNA_END=530 /DNA_ORIENTATION=+
MAVAEVMVPCLEVSVLPLSFLDLRHQPLMQFGLWVCVATGVLGSHNRGNSPCVGSCSRHTSGIANRPGWFQASGTHNCCMPPSSESYVGRRKDNSNRRAPNYQGRRRCCYLVLHAAISNAAEQQLAWAVPERPAEIAKKMPERAAPERPPPA